MPLCIELKDIYKQVNNRCILDGELVVMVNGVPDFYELQKRTLLTSRTRIELGAKMLPASFVAYDIVWCKPEKVCIVEYMPNTLDALRQPVFKGIWDDV